MQDRLVLQFLVKFIVVKPPFFLGSWGVRKARDNVVTMTYAEMNKWDIYLEIVPTLHNILKVLIKNFLIRIFYKNF
jgi:hypothetical protein